MFKPKRNFLHKKGFFYINGLPNVTFYACKRSFNCRYEYHTRKENQSIMGIVLRKVHAQKKFSAQKGICLHKGLPNVIFFACKRSFNYRYQYHMQRKNYSTASIVLKKVHAQKKIFCIKRDFSAQKGCLMLLYMPTNGYSIVGSNITREKKIS